MSSRESISGCMLLSEFLDEFLATRFIDRKKYYDAYLIIAKRAWQKLFRNTLYEVQTVWLTLQAGQPYNYIKVPKNAQRIFTVNHVDREGKIQPLFYNNQINIISKPTSPTCGCQNCKCDGLCDDVGQLQVTTQLLFSYNGIDYFKKCWIKICPNGDTLRFCETPVKSYNDTVGTPGDYNVDYNNDYLIGNPSLDNFTIVTQTTQEKICALEVKPCGCVVNTPQNVELINNFCGCYFPFGYWAARNEKPKTFLDDINSDCVYGDVKISEDNTKIYYIPKKNHANGIAPFVPQYLLLSFQTNGLDCNSEVVVPDYAFDYLCTDVDYRAKRFNSRYSLGEKQMAKYARNEEENDLILFLNNLNLQKIADIQDAPIYY